MNNTPTPPAGGHEPSRPQNPQPYGQPAPTGQPAAGAYPPPSGETHPGGASDQPTGVLGFGRGGGQPTGDTPGTNDKSKPRKGTAVIAAVALTAGLVGGGAGAAGMYFATAGDREQASVGADTGGDTSQSDSSQSESSNNTTSVTVEPSDVQQIADEVRKSVVSINIVTAMGSGGGSGVILSDDGLILTNNHVVSTVDDGSGQLSVTFDDGTTADAEIVGRDPVTDVAVIKAQGVSGLQPATLGDSGDLSVGQDVIAIGSPLGLSGTVTTGIVSALERPVRTGQTEIAGEASSTVIDAVQTDAAINPGNSGGALVDAAGQVVGINTAIASAGGSQGQAGSIGLGFAIPIDQAKPIADQLIADGTAEHAQLGVSVATATNEEEGVTSGAGVARVTGGGAAEEAGLQQGDVVTKIDDRAIQNADALIAAVRSYSPGDEVTVTYIRDGEKQTTNVTLGSDEGQTSVPEQPNQEEPQQRGPWDDLPPFGN